MHANSVSFPSNDGKSHAKDKSNKFLLKDDPLDIFADQTAIFTLNCNRTKLKLFEFMPNLLKSLMQNILEVLCKIKLKRI